jgi:hypothetical protein
MAPTLTTRSCFEVNPTALQARDRSAIYDGFHLNQLKGPGQ